MRPDLFFGAARRHLLRSPSDAARVAPEKLIRISPPRCLPFADETLRKVTGNADALYVPLSARRRTRDGNMKKSVEAGRNRIARELMRQEGWTLRGRPPGSPTGTKPGERSIPQAWRDLDTRCLEFALNKMTDETSDAQFVSCAARRAHFHERNGNYKITKLSSKSTGPRKPRTHEQRVRHRAKALVLDARRERLEL